MSNTFIVDSVGGISGSLTQLIDGTSYLIEGDGISITSQSNGSVKISALLSTQSDDRFGNGADGTAHFDGSATPAGSIKNSSTSYTLNRDVCYSTMTIDGSVTVNTHGYRIFCHLYATVSGTLCNTGSAGGQPTPGVGAAGGTLGNGAHGGAGQSSGGGQAGENITSSLGGNGGFGPVSQGAGTAITPNANQGTANVTSIPSLGVIFGVFGLTIINGGAGGGGTNAGSTTGGGGGGGGGVIALAASELRGTGSISVKGGPGGVSDFASYFGAGGGGGGVIFLASSNTGSWSGQLDVSGGPHGAGSNTNGDNGVAGNIFSFML